MPHFTRKFAHCWPNTHILTYRAEKIYYFQPIRAFLYLGFLVASTRNGLGHS